jgi:hypothetical protein
MAKRARKKKAAKKEKITLPPEAARGSHIDTGKGVAPREPEQDPHAESFRDLDVHVSKRRLRRAETSLSAPAGALSVAGRVRAGTPSLPTPLSPFPPQHTYILWGGGEGRGIQGGGDPTLPELALPYGQILKTALPAGARLAGGSAGYLEKQTDTPRIKVQRFAPATRLFLGPSTKSFVLSIVEASCHIEPNGRVTRENPLEVGSAQFTEAAFPHDKNILAPLCVISL